MIWGLLIVAVIIAMPLVAELRRKVMDDAARGSATGSFVELSQGVTHYEWHGPARGPVVVCVHGLTTPSFVWRSIAKALSVSGYRVLTYDLYGRGFSSRARGPQNQQFFLQQLTELLAHEGIEDDLSLIGYSMGGAISTCFAAKYPGRVRQLILLAPAGMTGIKGGMVGFLKNTPLIGDWLMMALYPAMHRKGVRAEANLPTSVPHITKLQEDELDYRGFVPAVLASLRGILARPLHAEHRTIVERDIPVLAIWGREDAVIPASAIGKLAEWNRAARQEVIEGAGHGLTYTHTDEVLRIMRDWMAPPDAGAT